MLQGPGASEPTKDAVRAVETLERALGDGEHEVREAAVVALGKLPPRRSASAPRCALTGRLDDEAAGVRQRAAEVLGHMGEARAVVPLLSRLGDPTREVRIAALEALAALRRCARGAGGGAHAPRSGRRRARGGGGRARALAGAARRWAARRGAAARAAGCVARAGGVRAGANAGASSGTTEAIDALIGALDSDELRGGGRRRRWCAWARARCRRWWRGSATRGPIARRIYVDLLREIGSPEATPALLDELGRGRLPEEAVVDALGAMLRAPGDKAQRLMVTLVALLGAPSGSLRRHAAEALRGTVDARAVSALATAASDDERDVRVIAVGELGRLGAREALPELERALGAADEETAAAAARALGQLGDRAARSSRSSARSGAASGECGARRPMRSPASADGSATPSLLRAVRTGGARSARRQQSWRSAACVRRGPTATARELLFGYAEGSDAAAALAALDALGAMGDARRACRAWLRIVESRFDDDVRGRAVAALGDIGGDDAARTLVDHARAATTAIRAARRGGLGAGQDQDSRARRRAPR